MTRPAPVDRPHAGTLVIRDGLVVYATEGAAALAGRPHAEIVGSSYVQLVAPEDRARLADRHARRLRGEAVPVEYEATMLLPDGRRRVLELRVDMDGEDTVVRLRDVSDEVARRPRLAALAALGAAIQREPSEPEIMARVRDGLWAMGLSSMLLRGDAEGARVEWVRAPEAVEAAFREATGQQLSGYRAPWSDFGRAAWGDGAAYTDDWPAEAAPVLPEPHREAGRALAVASGLSRAIAVRLDERAAVRYALVLVGAWVDAGDVPAARLFGAQVAAALDAARLLSDLRRRVGELTLLNDDVRRRLSDLEAVHALALRVFGNAPGDVQGVLEDGCREAARALSCRGAVVLLAAEDGRTLRGVAGFGAPIDPSRMVLALDEDGIAAAAFHRRAPAWSEDVTRDPRSTLGRIPGLPPLAMLAVPLSSRTSTRGVLFVADGAGRVFGEPDVALANALAGELAVGLENGELYAETRRVAAENARLYEDLRRSYAELADAQRQLIQQERLAALGELSAVVAHEVRNPLGVIFNSLGSLRRLLQPGGDAKMLLDIVGEEADRLNRIVGDLLDFARPSTPQLRPEPLDRVVDEAVHAALAQNAPGIELRLEGAPGLPAVPLDARLVRQAVLNVAVNAVQAMPRGGLLTVRLRHEPRAAVVEVEDTGPGIPEEVRHRIFAPFFTTKASGTGLGLAVVKRILDGHGGEVAVRCRPGAGTVFSLRFPLPSATGRDGDGTQRG